MSVSEKAEQWGRELRRARFNRTGRGATFDPAEPLTDQERADGEAAYRFHLQQTDDERNRLREALVDIRNRILCPVGPSPTLDEVEAIADAALAADDEQGEYRMCAEEHDAMKAALKASVEVRTRPASPTPDDPSEDGLAERLKEVTALLIRYRKETPPGHSPHMICHLADTAIERARAAIAALTANDGREDGGSDAS